MNQRVRTLLQMHGHEEKIAAHKIFVIGKDTCPFCIRTYALLEALGIPYIKYSISKVPPSVVDELVRLTGQSTVPIIYLGKDCIGGFNDLVVLMSRAIIEVVDAT
jgi:glutaredoxin 3